MSNQILEALLNRRSIRQYTNQPISEEILREMEKMGDHTEIRKKSTKHKDLN